MSIMMLSTVGYNASEVNSTDQLFQKNIYNGVYTTTHLISEETSGVKSTNLVTIPDSNLEKALSENLGIPIGEITEEDMKILTDLEMPDKNISNLTGLEYATNLTSLKLYNNEISDVTSLSGLTNLTVLSLNSNEISDIDPLSGLVNLTELGLTHNVISDITPLSGLTNLTNLELYQNQISDITPLVGLTKLTDLNLVFNQVTDVTALSGLTELDWLRLAFNQITDVTPLSELTKLEYLGLEFNQITDVTPLSKLTNLNSLILDHNQISDISPLSELKKLTWCILRNQSIFLEDIVVNDSKELFYTIIDIDGIEHQVSLGTPVEGTNEMTGDWSINTIFGTDSYRFSGNIEQTVTYDIPSALTGINTASSTEETRLSDEQLVTLFEVVNSNGLAISVDQSSVDYSTPGEYQVIFTDTDGSEFTATLTITDVLPTLDIDRDYISISTDSSLSDILERLIYSASEITAGDLTDVILIDDSSVDYSTPGDYGVIFTVIDEERNSVSKTVALTIIEENVETVDPEMPDEIEEINSVEKNEKTISVEATSRIAEAEEISKGNSIQMKLLTTGDKIAGTIIMLLTVVIIALGLKKYIRVK